MFPSLKLKSHYNQVQECFYSLEEMEALTVIGQRSVGVVGLVFGGRGHGRHVLGLVALLGRGVVPLEHVQHRLS